MNLNLPSRACPVCGGARALPRWEKGELRLVTCRDCGMVFANPAPAGMASGAFYDAAGNDYYLSPAKLESDYADVRFQRELRLFREFCPRGAVLDVGCSSGAFLFQLNKRWPGDYRIRGTDVSGPPLDYAESRGVPVTRGDFLNLDFALPIGVPASGPARGCASAAVAGPEAGAPFDAVTFWAVLEHLDQPALFLAKAAEVLKPDGLCFVLVPNLRSLAFHLLGARYRYVYPQHLNYFTAQTLAGLCAPHFQIVATRYSHFNPVIIWQDWRRGGREVPNAERAQLLKSTTALKQKPWLAPAKWCYALAEKTLGAMGLADNLVFALRRK